MVQASPRKPLQERNGDASARDTIRATQSLLSTLHAPEDVTKAYLSLHALKDTLGQYRTLAEDPLRRTLASRWTGTSTATSPARSRRRRRS